MYQWTRKVKGDIVQKSKNVSLGCVFVPSQFGSCPYITMNWCLSPVSTGPHWWYFTANATEEGLLEALKNRRMYLCLCEIQTPDSSNTSQNTLFVNHIYMGFVYLEMVRASKTHMSSLSTDGRKSSEHQLIDGKNGKSAGMCKTLKTHDLINYLLTGARWCKISSINSMAWKQTWRKLHQFLYYLYLCVLILKASIQWSVFIQTMKKHFFWWTLYLYDTSCCWDVWVERRYTMRGAWPFMR